MLILLPPSEKKSQTARPTPAIEVYTGVLYQALDWSSLTPAARKRGQSAVRIISAKYGGDCARYSNRKLQGEDR